MPRTMKKRLDDPKMMQFRLSAEARGALSALMAHFSIIHGRKVLQREVVEAALEMLADKYLPVEGRK